MNLNEYLNSPGALSVKELREAIGVQSDAQIRQWQHGYAGRMPDAANAAAIEKATDRRVMRWDLRPNDWHLIWPELVGIDGAPGLKESA
jgi:DNA-binding transcriptional regulator YdaS (Cro superfamily)